MRILTQVVKPLVLTTAFALALAASVAAAPQREGNRHAGGSQSRVSHQAWTGGPRARILAPRPHIVGPRGHIFIGGGFVYDPLWGPYYPYGLGYPNPWTYGYPSWSDDSSDSGALKTEVTPKSTEVYVDGYYAGTADDFDGVFRHLHATIGGHAITLHLDGYRTVTQNVYVRPDSTVKLKETMEKLAPGEVSAPVPQQQ
jgi:hypothetical protein